MGFTKRKRSAGFIAYTQDTITLTDDKENPNFFTNFTMVNPVGFKLVDPATGAVQNVSGRTLKKVTGSISVDPEKGSGVTANYNIFSERSTDGGSTWVVNEISRRVEEVANDGESVETLVSGTSDWQHGEIIRFRTFRIGTTPLSYRARSETVIGGQTIVSPSVLWELHEI